VNFSPILTSLAPFRDQMTVLTNLELRNAYPGSHATSNSSFLSAAKAKHTESNDYYLGTTADQLAAQQIGQDTQLPSLELANGHAADHRPVRQRLRVRFTKTIFPGHRPPRRSLYRGAARGSCSNGCSARAAL
jgi:hypothetical protein